MQIFRITSASLGLLLVDLDCSTYFLPAMDHYESWYPNPEMICENIVSIVVEGACSKIIAFQYSCYEVYGRAIELSQTNGYLKYISV